MEIMFVSALGQSFVRVLVLAAMLPQAGAPKSGNVLKIGSPAPPIRYMHWIKGEPVRTCQHGKVYVFDFFATWCDPCRRGMPHLTELAKKYEGEAIFVGIDVRQTEHEDGSLEKVQKFVQDNGANMGYRVAMDDPIKKTVFNDWMTAAGLHLIPTAFVVDKNGKIAWIGIGYPMVGLDEAVSTALGEAASSK